MKKIRLTSLSLLGGLLIVAILFLAVRQAKANREIEAEWQTAPARTRNYLKAAIA
jgi:hypothetical protein